MNVVPLADLVDLSTLVMVSLDLLVMGIRLMVLDYGSQTTLAATLTAADPSDPQSALNSIPKEVLLRCKGAYGEDVHSVVPPGLL